MAKQFDRYDNLINEFSCSITSSEVLKIPAKSIRMCCGGFAKTAYGFKWKYKNDRK